jgi:hypothetical protein
MATSASFAATPKNGTLTTQLTTANTGRDGTGTLVTVFTAGATGSRIDSIIIQATGTTTAGMIRFFLSNDSGTSKRLIGEVPVLANTPSGTTPAWQALLTSQNSSFLQNGLVLQASAILYAAPNNSETFNVVLLNAGDF